MGLLFSAYVLCFIGNRMKTRNSVKSFSKSYNEATYLYIAYSPRSHLFKLGITKELSQRLNNLNIHKPDGSSDWRYVGYVHLGKKITGVVETQLGTSLKKYNVHRCFHAKRGYCRELYSCELSIIIEYLNYRLLPEEKKILQKKIDKVTLDRQWSVWFSREFYNPKEEDNWNIKKGKYNPNNQTAEILPPKRNDLTPFSEMLQEKYGVRIP